jgi:uncharacterized protein HemY
VPLFAACRAGEPARQIEQAEGWLKDHSQDPALLYALGVLCARAELWGKAQTCFEASLALEPAWRTEVALAELFVKLARNDEANAHLAAALRLAMAELERHRQGRRPTSPTSRCRERELPGPGSPPAARDRRWGENALPVCAA